MDDVPDSCTTPNAPAPTTVEADDGEDEQAKMARKQTFDSSHRHPTVSVYEIMSCLKYSVC